MKLLQSLFLMAGLAMLAACAAQPEPVAAVAPVPVAAPSPPAAAVIAPSRQTFAVYFDSGRSDIRASAMQIIYQAWQEAKANGTVKITVTGFADSIGRKSANKMLSERRAKAVAGQFAKLGLTVAMDVSGKGEAAGSHRATDRRVEIVLEGGQIAADRHFAPVEIRSDMEPGNAHSLSVPQDRPQAVAAAADGVQARAMAPGTAPSIPAPATALAAAPRDPPAILTIVRGASQRVS